MKRFLVLLTVMIVSLVFLVSCGTPTETTGTEEETTTVPTTTQKEEVSLVKMEKDMLFAFSGDSITDGNRQQSMDCNHIFGHGYQYTVASTIGADHLALQPKFLNMGHTGWTSAMVYAKWNEEILSFKPDVISLLVGINDVANGWNSHASVSNVVNAYLKNYRRILVETYAALPNVQFVICEPFFKAALNHDDPYQNVPHPIHGAPFQLLDFGTSDAQIKFFEQALAEMREGLKELSEEFNCIYVPLQEVFDNAAKDSPVEYVLWDSVHPTIVGHQLIAKQWLTVVNPK